MDGRYWDSAGAVVEEQKTGRAIFVQALFGGLDIALNFTLFVTIGHLY